MRRGWEARKFRATKFDHVDSETLSGDNVSRCWRLPWAARTGKSKEFILEQLKSIREATETVYTLETWNTGERRRIGRLQAWRARF